MKNSRTFKIISIMTVSLCMSLFMAFVLTPNLPTDASPVRGVEMHTEIAYTDPVPEDTQGNLLDLYIPDVPGQSKLPLVIWSSGSAWMSDSGKNGAASIAEHFTQRGYAVAGVSVRSSSQVQFPGQLHDIREAIRWLREHADDYNIDPNRFAILGNSSGGWVASIAATTSNIWELEGEMDVRTSSAVQAAVPFFPPTDFLVMDDQEFSIIEHNAPDSPESLLIGCPIQDCPEKTTAANPIAYIDDSMPAMHIFHGYEDELVPHGQSVLLYEALAEAGNEVWFTSVPDAGHSYEEIIGANDYTVYWSNPGGQEQMRNDTAPTWENVERFINTALNRAR